ncbi:CoA transferase [Bordetella bronchiseptica]|nr:CoA transferase [Bordetella bronchiseptica]
MTKPHDSPQLPLANLRVLSVEQYGAGPFATTYLSDLGAEVIKVENHKDGGDVGRHVGPHYFGPEDSHFYQTFNRNKKSITLDLKHPEGKAAFQRLAGTVDAVFNNLRGDLPGKLGLDYESLKHVNARIVCTHLSAYGRTGSRTTWPGYDYLMQAETGFLTLTGEPGGPPARAPLSVIDLMTGISAAFALLAGVHEARTTGTGRDLDVSLFDTALHTLNYPGTWYLNAGVVTGKTERSGHPSLVPSQLFEAQDGWLFIMCNKEKFWPILVNELGHPEWAHDPRLATFQDRLRNKRLVTELIEAELATRPVQAWVERLSGKVPVAPVYDLARALDNDFVREQERIKAFMYDDGRTARMIMNPIRIDDPLPTRAAPAMGAHNVEVLRHIGFDDAAIERLRAIDVIAPLSSHSPA